MTRQGKQQVKHQGVHGAGTAPPRSFFSRRPAQNRRSSIPSCSRRASPCRLLPSGALGMRSSARKKQGYWRRRRRSDHEGNGTRLAKRTCSPMSQCIRARAWRNRAALISHQLGAAGRWARLAHQLKSATPSSSSQVRRHKKPDAGRTKPGWSEQGHHQLVARKPGHHQHSHHQHRIMPAPPGQIWASKGTKRDIWGHSGFLDPRILVAASRKVLVHLVRERASAWSMQCDASALVLRLSLHNPDRPGSWHAAETGALPAFQEPCSGFLRERRDAGSPRCRQGGACLPASVLYSVPVSPHQAALARGTVNQKVEPFPGALSTPTCP